MNNAATANFADASENQMEEGVTQEQSAALDGELYTTAIARALIHTRALFENAPHLVRNIGDVPGCGGLTWHELWALQDYSRREIERLAKQIR